MVCIIDTFCPGRQKVSKKRPYMLLRRIPATGFAEFFTSLIFACCSAAGFVNTPAKNSCACPLRAMFAEHRCSSEPVVRSGLRSAKDGVLFVNAKFWRSKTLCVVLRASVSLALLILFVLVDNKVSKKRPYVLLRRIPATGFAEFFTSLIFACCSAAGFVNTPAKNSCACPLRAMFAEHRCSSEPVVRSGLRSAEFGVLVVYKQVISA